jgi:hypothetical protein
LAWASSGSNPESNRQFAADVNEVLGIIKDATIVNTGNLYTVDLLPEDDEWLDWDKPLSEQSEKVRAAVESDELLRNIVADNFRTNDPIGDEIVVDLQYKIGLREASAKLASLGIPGIKYLDGNSRNARYYAEQTYDGKYRAVINSNPDSNTFDSEAEALDYAKSLIKGTSNYVIFDDKLVKILEENGRPVTPQRSQNIAAAAYSKGLPEDKIEAFANFAVKLIESGINTPESLAAMLERTNKTEYSNSLWKLFRLVDRTLPENPDWAEIYANQTAPQEKPKETPETSSQKLAVIARDLLLDGTPLHRAWLNAEMRKFGDLTAKQADEAVEVGIYMAARTIVEFGENEEETFTQLVDLYSRQPNLTARDVDSKVRQAFSTPVPLAYAAGVRIGAHKAESGSDRMGGNGLLTVSMPPEKVSMNELDPGRAATLRWLNFANVTEGDAFATEPFGAEVRMLNPPFGTIIENQNKKEFPLYGNLTTRQIDHALVMRELSSLQPGQRAAIIIGGKKGSDEGRRQSYQHRGDQLNFTNSLYNNFNVTDHFTVDGDLYSRQGAAWPVDIIIVEGKGASELPRPYEQVPPILNDWAAIGERLITQQKPNETKQPIPTERTSGNQRRGPSGGGSSAGGRSGRSNRNGGTNTRKGESPQEAPDSRPSPKSSDGSGPDGQSDISDTMGNEGKSGDAGIGPSGADSITPGREPNPLEGDSENPLQTIYVPRSGSPLQKDILTPQNLAEATRQALDDLEARRGNIDEFVLSQLDWLKSMDDLHEVLDGGQVDAVALGIDNIMRGKALVNGDQTGMGKGRVAASIMAWTIRQGKIPVFMTAKKNLYNDMLGDLADIKATFVKPWATDTDVLIENGKFGTPKGTGHKKIRDDEASSIYETGMLPRGANAIFTTYYQVGYDVQTGFKESAKAAYKRKRGRIPRPDGVRMQMFRALGDRAVWVMDEAHEASGNGDTNFRMMQILKGWDINYEEGKYTQPSGAYYSSATFAKRPDNMPIYLMSAIGDAVDDPRRLPDLFTDGGMGLMQATSNMLARSGGYLRREMSFNGVTFRDLEIGDPYDAQTNRYPIQWKQADNYTALLRRVIQFNSLALEFLSEVNKGLLRNGTVINGKTYAPQVVGTEFSAQVHNMVAQYLLAVKAKDVGKQAVEMLKSGVKPVITVQNTLEGPMMDTVRLGFAPNFRGLLKRYTTNALSVQKKDAEGNPVGDKYRIDPKDYLQENQALGKLAREVMAAKR